MMEIGSIITDVIQQNGIHFIKKKLKFFLILLIGIVFLITFSSAISLDNNVILNTSISNSSMTFSISITAEEINITAYNITLTNVVCSNPNIFISSVFWNTPNSNKESSEYCVREGIGGDSNGGGGGRRIFSVPVNTTNNSSSSSGTESLGLGVNPPAENDTSEEEFSKDSWFNFLAGAVIGENGRPRPLAIFIFLILLVLIYLVVNIAKDINFYRFFMSFA